MNTVSKIAIGVSVASGVLLAAWLLSGDRKPKTKAFISASKQSIRKSVAPRKRFVDEGDFHYV
jgi:hypothetical protein